MRSREARGLKETSSGYQLENGEDEQQNTIISCSVEESNRLRAKLGLAPLKLDKKDTSTHKDAVPAAKPSSTTVRSRIADAKARRAREELLRSGSSWLNTLVGEDNEDDDLDPTVWVAKNRAFQKKKQQQGNRQYEDLEEKDASEDERLPDLRVAHDLDTFSRMKVGEDVVLTLQDTPIINERGELHDDTEDNLENQAFLEEERRSKRRKERSYNPVDDGTVDEKDLLPLNTASRSRLQRSTDILPHYDEWAETEGGTKAPARASADARFTLSQLSGQQEPSLPTVSPVTLTSSVGLQRDFMTPEEAESYRRRTEAAERKKKLTEQKRKALLMKAMKKKRSLLDTDNVKKEEQEEDDENPDFISPLLSMQTNDASGPAVPPNVDDVDIDDALLYAQLSKCRRQLQNRAAHASSTELTPNGAALAAPEVKNAEPVKQEDAASVVRARVMELHAAERLIQTEDHKSVAVEGQEPATSADVKIEDDHGNGSTTVELSDITEFCRTLQTTREKMESLLTSGKAHRGTLVGTAGSSTGRSWRENAAGGESSRVSHLGDRPESELGDQDTNDSDESSDGEGITDEEKNVVRKILDENVLDGGLTSALNYLKSRGELEDGPPPRRGRRNPENAPLHMSTNPNDVKLEYKDEYGRVMTPKEAFRYISWVFHGKGPGKRKREKMLRKMELDKKIKSFASNHQQLPTMKALRKQQKTGQAHLVLSGTTQ